MPECEASLSALATDRNVSVSTQNLALSSILFLYKEVPVIDLPWLDNILIIKQGRMSAQSQSGFRQEYQISHANSESY